MFPEFCEQIIKPEDGVMGALGELVTQNPIRSIGDNLNLQLASEMRAALWTES